MTKSSTTEELASATMNNARWAALIGRDVSADGKLYHSVKTMGVYCRPSCTVRLARSEFREDGTNIDMLLLHKPAVQILWRLLFHVTASSETTVHSPVIVGGKSGSFSKEALA